MSKYLFAGWRQPMPRIVLALMFFLSAFAAMPASLLAAQVPPQILTYQGRLTDSSGNLLGGSSGTAYYFKFSIWTAATVGTGSRVWPASAPASVAATVKQGVFTVNIGDTANGYPTALDLDFSANPSIYLQVEASSDNVTFETLSPRQQLTAAAFAQVAGAVIGTATPSVFGTTMPVSNSFVTIAATSTNSVALSLIGVLNQTANLFQIQSSAGTNLFSVGAAGGVSMTAATTTNFFATTASSTDLFTSNLSIGSLSGILKATAGAIGTALVNLASDVTGILPVGNGGTGLASIAANAVLLGNGTGKIATTSAGVNGQVLALVNGVPTFVATTTFSAPLAYGNGAVSFDFTRANTFTGLQQFNGNASTTVLTVSGAASTTDLTVSRLAGFSTTCVQADINGKLSATGSACGSGSGAVSSVSNSDGTLTISPTTGVVVASLNLAHGNTFTALQQFSGGASSTGELSAVTASSTNLIASQTFTFGAASGALSASAGVVSAGTLSVANGGTGSTTLSGILVGNGTNQMKTLGVGSGLSFDGTTLSASGGTTYSATYPITLAGSAFGLAFGTTTSNIWAGTQTFTNAPKLASFTGLVGANGGTTYAISTTSLNANITGNAGTVANGVYTTTFGTLFDNRLSATTSVAGISALPSLSITKSQVSDFGTYENPLTFSFPLSRSANAVSFGGLSTSTAAVVGNIPYFSGANTFANAATSSIAVGSGISVTSGTLGSQIGGSAVTLGIAANALSLTQLPQIAANSILGNAAGVTGNVTAIATSSLGINFSTLVGTVADNQLASTFLKTAVTSLAAAYPLQTTGSTGSITLSSALATTSSNTWAGTQTFATATTTNLIVSSAGGAGTRCAQFAADGTISATSGACGVAGAGIQNIGPANQLANSTTVTVSTTTSSFNGLTVGNTVMGTANSLTWQPTLSGTLTIGGGGTGLSSLSGNQILYTDAAGTALLQTSTSTLSIGGNAATVTNGVYTTTFGTLFDNRLSATTSVSGITTLPNLSLPSGQVSGLGSLAALSSVNNGNWSGTQLSAANGGTGSTTLTGILKGSGTGQVQTAIPGTDYLTGNQSITLSGDVSGTGTTAIAATIGANKVTTGMLAQAPANTLLGNATGALGNVTAIATSSLGINFSTLVGTVADNQLASAFLKSIGSGSIGQLAYWNGANSLTGVATTSVSCSGNTACTSFTVLGSSPVTISSTGGGSGLSTTTPIASSNLLVYSGVGAGAAYGVATSSIAVGSGISVTSGTLGSQIGGSAVTLGIAANALSLTQLPQIAANSILGNATGALGNVTAVATSSLFQNASAATGGLLTSTDWSTFNSKGSGTVTAVSVASLNGFAGSSSGGATPALTITTSVSGLLKGNGTGLSAAANGVDYTLVTANTCANQALTALTAAGGSTCSSITDSFLSGAIGIAHGGTNNTSFSTGGVAYYDGTKLANVPAFAFTGTNLGVGSSTPAALLAVHAQNGNTNTTLFAVASSTASATTTLFSVDNTGLTTVGDSSGTGDAVFQFAGDINAWAVGYKSSDKSFNIASSTNFTGTSQFSLAKNGNLTIVGSAVTCVIGNGVGATSCSSSDERLKTNITPLSALDGLAAIRALDPVSFNWNAWMQSNGSASSTQFGFIAQQVQKVFPNLVTQDLNTGYYKLDYQQFISPLVKSVQELDQNLSALSSSTASTTPAAQSFAAGFFSHVASWLGDAANGIADFFANRVHTKQLCLSDDSGAETCITKGQLDRLLAGAAAAPASAPAASLSITVNGANPTHLAVGDAYVEQGATVSGGADAMVSYGIFVNGGATATSSPWLDTSVPTTYILTYVATDSTGTTVSATRSIIVGNPDGSVSASSATATTTADTAIAADSTATGATASSTDTAAATAATSSAVDAAAASTTAATTPP